VARLQREMGFPTWAEDDAARGRYRRRSEPPDDLGQWVLPL